MMNNFGQVNNKMYESQNFKTQQATAIRCKYMWGESLQISNSHPLFLIILILCFLTSENGVQSSLFCSINCLPGKCISASDSNSCSQCDSRYQKVPDTGIGTCIFDSSNSSLMIEWGTTPNFTISPLTSSNCSIYTIYGGYSDQEQVNLQTDSAIGVIHYELELILWLILIDGWAVVANDSLLIWERGNLNSNSRTVFANESAQDAVQYCSSTNQSYVRMIWTFSHNDSQNALDILLKSSVSSTNKLWGVKEMVLLAKLCNATCGSCSGPNQNQCLTCSDALIFHEGYCLDECPDGFGVNASDSNPTCFACHEYCLVCQNEVTNCSSCREQTLDSEQPILFTAALNECGPECHQGYQATYEGTVRVCTVCDSEACSENNSEVFSESVLELNNGLRDFLTQKGVQEIPKSGLLAIFVPGAQFASLSLIAQTKISSNMYEHLRLWSSFVYFQVPAHSQDSPQKEKYIFSTPQSQYLQNQRTRLLQTSSDEGSESIMRLGYSGYFVLDCYLQILMVSGCWVMVLLSCLICKYSALSHAAKFGLQSKVFAVFHKIHQISLFYFLLISLLQYIGVKNESSHLYVISLCLSIGSMAYYVGYSLKTFYDLQQVPYLVINSQEFDNCLMKYSYFLCYFRYEEFNDLKNRSPPLFLRALLRPYNFATVQTIRKVLMIAAVVIFEQQTSLMFGLLLLIQFLAVIRYAITIPYKKMARNWIYGGLETLLMIFFLSCLLDVNSQTVFGQSFSLGFTINSWTAVVSIHLYNLFFLVVSIVEFIIICRSASMPKMFVNIYQQYHRDLLNHYQLYGSYYRLASRYAKEFEFCQSVKKGNTYADRVNTLLGVEPVINLSKEQNTVSKEIIQRGSLWIEDYQFNSDSDRSRSQIEIRMQRFILRNIELNVGTNLSSKINHSLQISPPKINPRLNLSEFDNQNSDRKLKEGKNDAFEHPNYELSYDLVTQAIKRPKKNHNTSSYSMTKRIKGTESVDSLNDFQKHICRQLLQFKMPHTKEICFCLYASVDLRCYDEGDSLKIRKENIRQEISISTAEKSMPMKIYLQEQLKGFPVSPELFQDAKS